MSGFPAFISLADLNGTNGFRIDGIDAGGQSGYSVSAAGDVNGDGFDDVIIGAFGAYPNGEIFAGESYVVFGQASGFSAGFDLANLDGTNGFRLYGIDNNDRSGISVSSAGDVNSDGFDDIIIGAPNADPNGNASSGESYVVFGQASGFSASIDLASLNGTNGFRLDGIDSTDESGRSVSSAGDVNGDGFDDVIVGAYGGDPNGAGGEGESYVVFGQASGFSASVDLASLNGTNGFRLDGIDSTDESGRSVSSAGDVNGDGFDDVIVGAYQANPNGTSTAGESYVVFGQAAGFNASFDLASLNGTNGFRINGVSTGDRSGYSVSSAGDVNGDGFDDVIIGAYSADPNGIERAGESYVVFGKASGFSASLDLATLNGSNGFRLDGIDLSDFSGLAVSSAGDINGDGFDDVIVGALGADSNGSARSGESYVVFGQASGFSASFDLASLDGSNGFRLDGVDAGDQIGISVSSAGDVNGDGFDDIIIGANGADPNGESTAGESYVVFGQAPTSATVRFGSETDQTIRGGAFDDHLNGMGGDDILVGGAGNDVLVGDFDIDTLHLNPGNETGQYAELAGFDIPQGDLTAEILFKSDEPLDPATGLIPLLGYAVPGDLEELLIFAYPEGSFSGDIGVRINGTNVLSGISTSEILDGNPHRISVTYDASNGAIEIYLDGRLIVSGSTTAGNLQTGGTLVFGQEQDGIPGPFGFDTGNLGRGEIADIRIWNDLRTADEIADNAFREIDDPAGDPSLAANWQPDPSNTTMVPDVANPGGATDLTLDNYEDGPPPGFSNFGGNGNDELYAGDGDDIVQGGLGNDRAFDGDGDDFVELGAGNDYVRVGGGVDSFDGGAGNDYISYYDSTNGVTLDLAANTASGSWAVNDTVLNFESASGSGTGDDDISGTSGANTIRTYGGDDRVYDRGGNDTIELGSGNDYVRVGGGVDSFDGGAGNDYISYYDSTNGVTLDLAANTASGSWAVNDSVLNFESASGSRTGDDDISGTSGANTIRTYGGDDRVYDRGGNDTIELGSGNDYVRVGGGVDSFDGGSGTDYISYYDSSNGVTIDFAADTASGSWAVNDTVVNFEGGSGSNTGDDDMRGTSSSNVLYGFGGDDYLSGRSGADRLYGGNGDDRLLGGSGADQLYGGRGNDFLDGGGGSGTDLLFGGAGIDQFHFDRGEGDDIIRDFENNIDVIEFDNFTGLETLSVSNFIAFYATTQGSDVLFDFGSDGTLLVENTTIGQLQNDVELV